VTLKLSNLISPQLKLLSEEFTKLEGLSVSLNSALKSIGTEAAGLRTLAAAGNASNRALEKAAASAGLLERRLIGIRAASAGGGGGLPLLPVPGGGGRPGGGNPRLPGGGGRGGGPGGFHGGNIHMGPGGIGLGTAGMAAGDWFWPLAATGAAMYGGKALFESAKDLDTEKQRFMLLGLSRAQNADAFSFVRDNPIFGTTQLERLSAFREAQGVGREAGLPGARALDFAKLASPVLARLDALGQGLDDESKGALHGSNIALLRFVEQAGGLKGSQEFERLANVGYKLRQSSGGTIDFRKLLGVTQQGGAYTQNMTELGWAHAEPILQEVGGPAYGTGIATAGSRLFNVMSRTPKNLIAEATRLGLWTSGRQHLSDADSKLFKEDFEGFYMERMLPLYDKFKLNPNDRIRENAILFGRTGSRIANLINDKNIPSILKSEQAFKASKSINAASDQLKNSASGQELEFTAAWTDFKTQFGTKMLPFFTGILKAGSVVLRALPNSGQDATPVGFGAHLVVKLAEVVKWVEGSQKSYVPAGGFGRLPASTPVNINIDGKKVASAVVPHIARAATAPQTGPSFYDIPHGGGIPGH
jgi:hypothetical protein